MAGKGGGQSWIREKKRGRLRRQDDDRGQIIGADSGKLTVWRRVLQRIGCQVAVRINKATSALRLFWLGRSGPAQPGAGRVGGKLALSVRQLSDSCDAPSGWCLIGAYSTVATLVKKSAAEIQFYISDTVPSVYIPLMANVLTNRICNTGSQGQ